MRHPRRFRKNIDAKGYRIKSFRVEGRRRPLSLTPVPRHFS
jgi:hypothetical protein